jgi:hypothetical protein
MNSTGAVTGRVQDPQKSGAATVALFCAVAIAIMTSPTRLVANESKASICSTKLQQFVQELDEILIANPASVLAITAVVNRNLFVNGCNVDDAISISKKSKFFSEAYEQYASYTVIFRSDRFIVTFGLRKDTGNIVFPAAQVILPKANERRT